jgi:translation initiation factor IF-3
MNRKRKKHKIGFEIINPRVRVVGEHAQNEIMTTNEARELARNLGLDLILISETSEPPVAKIANYSKFIYELEKTEKLRKKNSQKNELREIQLSATIADNDLLTKSRKAIELLAEGNKVKCTLLLKGRQKALPEQGELVMLKFAQLCENGSPENLPKLEGSKWLMILKPKKV